MNTVMVLYNVNTSDVSFRKLIYNFRTHVYVRNIVNSTYLYTCATAAHLHIVLFFNIYISNVMYINDIY